MRIRICTVQYLWEDFLYAWPYHDDDDDDDNDYDDDDDDER